MYLFPALTCEPVIGSLEAFTKGILRVFEAVLTEPETEINTGRLAPEASAVCLTSKTITPSLGNLHHTLGQIPNTTFYLLINTKLKCIAIILIYVLL